MITSARYTKRLFDILNEGAEIVSKYIFLESHVYFYIKDNLNPKDDDPEESYFHIADQFMEVKLEVINLWIVPLHNFF
jgi:hypothetical protein